MIHSYSTLTVIISRFSKEDIFRLFIILHSLGFKNLDERYEAHKRYLMSFFTESILLLHMTDLTSSFKSLDITMINNNIKKGRYNMIESYEKFLNLLPEITKVVTECVWTE